MQAGAKELSEKERFHSIEEVIACNSAGGNASGYTAHSGEKLYGLHTDSGRFAGLGPER